MLLISPLASRIAFSSGRDPVEAAVSFAADHDVRWLEVACQEPVNQPHAFDRDRRRRLRSHLAAHDVRPVVHTASSVNAAELVPGLRVAATTYLAESVRLAVDLGSPSVVVHAGFHFSEHVESRLEALTEVLIETAALAAAEGVILALENMNVLAPDSEIAYLGCTADEVVRILDEVDSPALTCCFDVGHAHLLPGGPVAFLERVGARIGHVQVTDNDGVVDHHLRLGTGSLDIAATLYALDAIGYDGPVAIELPDRDDQVASRSVLLDAAGAAG